MMCENHTTVHGLLILTLAHIFFITRLPRRSVGGPAGAGAPPAPRHDSGPLRHAGQQGAARLPQPKVHPARERLCRRPGTIFSAVARLKALTWYLSSIYLWGVGRSENKWSRKIKQNWAETGQFGRDVAPTVRFFPPNPLQTGLIQIFRQSLFQLNYCSFFGFTYLALWDNLLSIQTLVYSTLAEFEVWSNFKCWRFCREISRHHWITTQWRDACVESKLRRSRFAKRSCVKNPNYCPDCPKYLDKQDF